MKNVVDDCMEELEKLVTSYPRLDPHYGSSGVPPREAGSPAGVH